ncbi:MAG: MscL family protein [Candidatus Pacebacteria bacterium]|nr:MscL family protein [Candidatus Paceibacterota bacterium]
MKTFAKEFAQFLKEYKVISLAIAFVMGTAATGLVNSLVNDIFMPMLGPVLSVSGSWRGAVLNIGAIHITYGSFIAQLINFIIIAIVIFVTVRIFFKDKETK